MKQLCIDLQLKHAVHTVMHLCLIGLGSPKPTVRLHKAVMLELPGAASSYNHASVGRPMIAKGMLTADGSLQ